MKETELDGSRTFQILKLHALYEHPQNGKYKECDEGPQDSSSKHIMHGFFNTCGRFSTAFRIFFLEPGCIPDERPLKRQNIPALSQRT